MYYQIQECDGKYILVCGEWISNVDMVAENALFDRIGRRSGSSFECGVESKANDIISEMT